MIVQCAWCGAIKKNDSIDKRVSHGICVECKKRVEEEYSLFKDMEQSKWF